jgi:hypothetical protein
VSDIRTHELQTLVDSEPDKSAAAATAIQHALDELCRAGEAVTAIGAALAIPPERLAAAEAIDRLELDTPVDLHALEDLADTDLAAWFDALAPDLRLDLRLATLDADGGLPSTTLRKATGAGELVRAFCAAAEESARGDETVVELRLAIGKTRVRTAARALGTAREESSPLVPRAGVLVCYHAPALTRLMSIHTASEWERLGLASADGRALVVLCNAAGYLAGPALEILGARRPHPGRWLLISRSTWIQFEQRAREMRALHSEESVWPGVPRVLTPEHLRLQEREPGLEGVAARLATMRAELAAAFLCSTAHDEPYGALALRFAGTRPCVCHIPALPDAAGTSGGSAEQANALARLASWAYQHGSPDKLAIARESLAAELPAGRDVTLADVERAAPAAVEAAKANFVLYLRHNSAAYFQRRQQALDAVTAYAETVRKAVGDLTGEVVDAVYRTAGLLLGVVIAGLIQPTASLDVQRLACVLITGYVLFVLLFLMRARRQRYELDTADLDGRLEAMSELSISERVRLRERTIPANQLFERYFRISQAVYIGLAAAGAVYFLLLLTPLAPHIALPHAGPTPVATPPP